MQNLILFIPFIFCLFLLIFFHKKVVWWEYIIVIVSSVIINFLVTTLMKVSNCQDTQYLGDYAIEVRYYEAWNEWVHKTCTRTRTDGKGHIHTSTYDCSYCRHHPEEWKMITSLKKSYSISKDDYKNICKLWGAVEKKVDLHRKYYTKDGDMFVCEWNNIDVNIIPITVSDSYYNKIKGSKSVFHYDEISKKEAKELGLFDYPQIIKYEVPFPQKMWQDTYQNCVIGLNDKCFSTKMNYINAKYGSTKHIRTYILFFKDKPYETAFKQESYWEGGNFNELVICLGVNSKTKTYDWVHTFSLEETPNLATKTKQWFISNDSLKNINIFPNWYENTLKEDSVWKCRDKEDFEYLKTELTNNQLIWLFVISLIICIGVSVFVIINGVDYDNNGNIICK